MKSESDAVDKAADAPLQNTGVSEIVAEKLKFRWCQEVSQYGDKLLQRLDEFRKKNMFYDVTLTTVDAEFAAHKVVLAACGGMFRSYFVEPKTNRIASDVTEVSFACPAAGLKPILKFAYSGTLEFTQANLLPTFLAAIVTEMKEVQEICAKISMTRLSWMLLFNGSEDTLFSLNQVVKDLHKHEHKCSLEEAFDFLHNVLQCNAVNFPADSRLFAENNLLKPDTDKITNSSDFPCMNVVKARWPELVHVYVAVLKCLLKAKALSNIKLPEKTQEKISRKSNSAHDNSLPTASAETSSMTDSSAPDAVSEETKDEDHIHGMNASIASLATTEGEDIKNEISCKTTTPIPSARKGTVKNSPKPVPRSASVKTHHENSSLPKDKEQQQSPLPREHSKSVPPAPSPARPSQKVSSSPLAPRRKMAAPRPPGPPPPPMTHGSSSPQPNRNHKEPIGKAPTQARPGKSTPTSGSKVPPPRPKPPSVRKKVIPSKTDAAALTNYDDALNPFSDETIDEEDPENLHSDGSTSSGSKGLDSAVDTKRDCDDSRNPFGET